MAERVFLHVGTPKSGTTHLQSVLWHNADQLKSAGLLLPGRFQTHYAAAKGLTDRSKQMRKTRVHIEDAWPRLTRRINRWRQDALVSHELLAPASDEQAAAAKAMLAEAEVHIVVTARALHRQLPASWQQQVQGGASTPYDVFIREVRDRRGKGAWFWGVQDVPDIARRWAGDLPSERVHVVTVPTTSAQPRLLWQRYASVLGLEPDAYDVAAPAMNMSLGLVESELLRLVNAFQDPRFRGPERLPWTRKLLANRILGKRRGLPIRPPADAGDWLSERAAAMTAELHASGYDV
ncbi:MAG: hypothetical protein ACR2GB_07930, partial [Nocardioidaceae bacterium]